MESHEEHHHEEHHVIGLIPSIIFLIALAAVVVWYSIHSSAGH